MQIIPVIDLKDGCVVNARHGNRSDYQPNNSYLCHSSSIENVLDAFLNLYDFRTFYIADLNAISNTGTHRDIIQDISNLYSNIEFWVDNGMKLNDKNQVVSSTYKTVIGSESQLSASSMQKSELILSLDFNQQNPLGPLELFENNKLWPKNIIIMTLARVGSQAGPDFKRLGQYCRQYPEFNFIAAGGIRNLDDLFELNKLGIKQALLASSLHSGKITSRDIQNLQTKKYPENRGIFYSLQ